MNDAIEHLTRAIEMMVPMIRQMVAVTPAYAGMAGFANQIEALVKMAREANMPSIGDEPPVEPTDEEPEKSQL